MKIAEREQEYASGLHFHQHLLSEACEKAEVCAFATGSGSLLPVCLTVRAGYGRWCFPACGAMVPSGKLPTVCVFSRGHLAVVKYSCTFLLATPV
jgi:hypothetical protein